MSEDGTTKGPYWFAPEVDRYIYQLVEKSALFPHLQGVPITGLFTDKDMKVKGRSALAKIKKATELEISLVENMRDEIRETHHISDHASDRNRPAPAWLVIVNYEMWLDLQETYVEPMQDKTVDQKEALIYHELCHVKAKENEKTGEVKLSSKDHDFMGFYDEVYRYGAWMEEYANIVKAVKGEYLPGSEDE